MKGFRCQIGPFSQTRSMAFFIVQSFNYWHCSKILFVSLITWSLHVAIRAWDVVAAKVQFSLLCHTRHCALWVYTVHCVLHCALCTVLCTVFYTAQYTVLCIVLCTVLCYRVLCTLTLQHSTLQHCENIHIDIVHCDIVHWSKSFYCIQSRAISTVNCDTDCQCYSVTLCTPSALFFEAMFSAASSNWYALCTVHRALCNLHCALAICTVHCDIVHRVHCSLKRGFRQHHPTGVHCAQCVLFFEASSNWCASPTVH